MDYSQTTLILKLDNKTTAQKKHKTLLYAKTSSKTGLCLNRFTFNAFIISPG